MPEDKNNKQPNNQLTPVVIEQETYITLKSFVVGELVAFELMKSFRKQMEAISDAINNLAAFIKEAQFAYVKYMQSMIDIKSMISSFVESISFVFKPIFYYTPAKPATEVQVIEDGRERKPETGQQNETKALVVKESQVVRKEQFEANKANVVDLLFEKLMNTAKLNRRYIEYKDGDLYVDNKLIDFPKRNSDYAKLAQALVLKSDANGFCSYDKIDEYFVKNGLRPIHDKGDRTKRIHNALASLYRPRIEQIIHFPTRALDGQPIVRHDAGSGLMFYNPLATDLIKNVKEIKDLLQDPSLND